MTSATRSETRAACVSDLAPWWCDGHSAHEGASSRSAGRSLTWVPWQRESRLWSAHFSVLNKQYPCFLLPHDRTRLTMCSSHQHFLDVRFSSENDRSHRSPSRGRTAYHPAAIIIADHDVRSAAGFEIGEIRVHSGRARALSPSSKCVVPDAVFQAIATGY